MTLTWGQFSNLTFLGQTIYHSTRLDKTNTMMCKSFLCHICNSSYCRKTISVKTGHFDLSWPLEAKPLTRPQNGWNYVERASKELSNAFFCAFLALLVSELPTNESENVEISKILPFLTPGDVIFYFIEKMTEIFLNDLVPSFRTSPAACLYDAQEPS